MALFVAEHRHPADHCPAQNSQMAPMLLQLLQPSTAAEFGVKIHGEAVATGQHHLYLIVDAADEGSVRKYLAPFAQVGSLDVLPSSSCEAVVARGFC